ncbi:hypothetical protein WMF38_31370 [Sorangium sp. So ce118]
MDASDAARSAMDCSVSSPVTGWIGKRQWTRMGSAPCPLDDMRGLELEERLRQLNGVSTQPRTRLKRSIPIAGQ